MWCERRWQRRLKALAISQKQAHGECVRPLGTSSSRSAVDHSNKYRNILCVHGLFAPTIKMFRSAPSLHFISFYLLNRLQFPFVEQIARMNKSNRPDMQRDGHESRAFAHIRAGSGPTQRIRSQKNASCKRSKISQTDAAAAAALAWLVVPEDVRRSYDARAYIFNALADIALVPCTSVQRRWAKWQPNAKTVPLMHKRFCL